MQRRASKTEDMAETAFRVASQATGGLETTKPDRAAAISAAASALGRLGASKGGKARAANLTAAKRKAIAKKAAAARWK